MTSPPEETRTTSRPEAPAPEGAADQTRTAELQRTAQELNGRLRRERDERREVERRVESLTPREREVMARVAEGTMNKNIARQLGITQRTVEIHRAGAWGRWEPRRCLIWCR